MARSKPPHERRSSNGRGLSPVVGTVLLVAIVVLLIGVFAVVFFGATEKRQPAPEAKLTLDPAEGNDSYVLEMQAGETIDGDQVRLRGVVNSDALAGRNLTASDKAYLTPTAETVRVVWETDQGEKSTYTLQTFDVDPSGGLTGFSSGTVFTGTGGDIVQTAGDGGTVSTLLSSGSINGIGSPGGDATGDGAVDSPYVTSGEVVKTVDPDGDVTTVTDSSAISGSIETQKTRLAVGSWNGSPTSVFFVDQNHDTVYRATPSTTTTVATPSDGDGAQAVAGPADIDGDGADELVYVDASQTVKYLQADGTVEDTTLSLGSSTGIGIGATGTLPGYGSEVVTAVDGGNHIVVVSQSGNDKITSGDVSGGSPPQAAKAPTTVADVDGDGENEVVYVGANGGDLKYLDDLSGTIEIEFLRDESGDKIDGDTGSGVV